ncbi:MAG: metallophosphoesterase [Euryarchaeota archaeon]|nr:metallophosphoesterase [Euryarchaeota archaeon]
MQPIYSEKALVLGEHMIIADLHLGVEHEFSERGMLIQSQLKKMKDKIAELLKISGAKKLIILGDLKHNIPKISWQEYAEIPRFIDSLSKRAELILIKGNHDGNLEKLLPEFKILKKFSIGREALLMHGHAGENELDYNYIIMGHNHPCIDFKDEFGRSIRESAWIRAKFAQKARKLYKLKKNPDIIIMPAFNDLLYGTPFNAKANLLGPFFKRGLIDLENAKAYLLDGTFLGKIKELEAPGKESY